MCVSAEILACSVLGRRDCGGDADGQMWKMEEQPVVLSVLQTQDEVPITKQSHNPRWVLQCWESSTCRDCGDIYI